MIIVTTNSKTGIEFQTRAGDLNENKLSITEILVGIPVFQSLSLQKKSCLSHKTSSFRKGLNKSDIRFKKK